ncbi:MULTISPECIES: DedA family protein [Pedobacter]|uniref:DedA family protein n=1 Tax=Pedobacter panaciterrae TaxID=363849 RepID=A0ABU8NHS6_9SPHI|nr:MULTISPECIES: DedA family protein [Pedobacter]ETZ23301.1 membrane protein [Pedobacter sp. V48]NQX53818.1 DedA family protein [Pedobacter panaciterrae]
MEFFTFLIDFLLHIDKHLEEIIRDYQNWTYAILFLIIFAETGFVVTPFLPGDSLLFAMGTLIAGENTGLSIWVMLILLIVAAILGNSLNYKLGSYFGVRVFKENNRILKLEYYNQSHMFFEKHGGKAIIFSRFLPIFRTIAPFVAGVAKMPFGRFTLFNVIGGVAWITSLLMAGYLLGQIPVVKKNFDIVIVVIAVVTFFPAIFAALRSKFKKKEVKE